MKNQTIAVLAICARDDLAFAKRGAKCIFWHLKDFGKGSEMRNLFNLSRFQIEFSFDD